MSKNSLVTQLRTLAAQLACETELLRQKKRESRRWSCNWHQLDGQIKALLWVSREVKSLLVAAQHSRPSRSRRSLQAGANNLAAAAAGNPPDDFGEAPWRGRR